MMHSALAMAQGDALVEVGTRSLSVRDVQRYLDDTPPKRVVALGATSALRKRHFVEDLIVPRVLAEVEAEERMASGQLAPLGREFKNRALSGALDTQLRRQVKVKEEDIAAFFEKYKAEYQRPMAIKLWRILVGSEQAAKTIIEEVGSKGNGVEIWWKLAREQSLDDATKYRYGELGFVQKSGQTDVPQLRVNPALYAAVEKLKDGEMTPVPVREGENWAVVWRRGTRPAQARTLDQERASIRQILRREAAYAARKALVERLRAEYVGLESPELIESIDYPEATVTPKQKPSKTPRPAADPSKPKPTLRGDR